jgi:aminopeptidase-like protein
VAWTLNLSDGDHTLLDVAERASLPFRVIARAASLLVDASLLVPAARDRS